MELKKMVKDLKVEVEFLIAVDETQVDEKTISHAICDFFGFEEDELKVTKLKNQGVKMNHNPWKYICKRCKLEQPYGTGRCRKGCGGFLNAVRKQKGE